VILAVVLFLGFVDSSLAAKEVSVSGSTTVMPLGEVAAEEFNFLQQEYHVSVTGGGSGAGVNNIAEGRSDVAMTSREIALNEKKKYGDRFQEYLIGYDGIGVAVSSSAYDGGVKNLSKNQIRMIYEGEITRWSQVGGPDKGIYVVSREQGSGTTDTFNEVILGNKKAETPGARTIAMSSAEVKTAIAGSDRAIGYLGYSYVQGKGINVIAFDGKKMDIETIKNGTYPLARKLYLVTFGDPTLGAKAYIDFLKSQQGQKIAQENGFIPQETQPNQTSIQRNLTSATKDKLQPEEMKQPGFEAALALAGLFIMAYYASLKRKA
jgi:phosphate transport system substrate-binding protein